MDRRTTVKIWSGVTKNRLSIKKKARALGLDVIDFDKTYSLHKMGAKKKSSYGYADSMVAIDKGFPFVVGSIEQGKVYVWLMLEGNGWWKTSPVVKCTPGKGVINIETENSLYELRPTNG